MARMATWLGGSVAFLCVVAHLVMAILMLSTPQGWDPGFALMLGFPVVGAVIVSHKPRNAIGWLLVISGASISFGLLCSAIVYAKVDPDPAIWQRILAWLTNLTFIGGFEGLIVSMAFLFPTGRTLSPRWRMAGIAVGLMFVLSFVPLTFKSGPVDGFFADTPELTNPFAIPGFNTVAERTDFLVTPLGLAIFLTSLSAIVARVRRARSIERLQLQWLALALVLVGVSLALSALAGALLPDSLDWLAALPELILFPVGTIGISVAIGIAILRHHLYDIERLVNRSIVYVVLSVALVLVYLGLVLLLGSVLRSLTGASSSIVTAVSTLAAAALFSPLRSGIQRVVDRRFYRRKYDAAQMIESFSARLRDDVDLTALSVDLQSLVAESMQPSHVSLWLRTMADR